jgi:hypothetical protein
MEANMLQYFSQKTKLFNEKIDFSEVNVMEIAVNNDLYEKKRLGFLRC